MTLLRHHNFCRSKISNRWISFYWPFWAPVTIFLSSYSLMNSRSSTLSSDTKSRQAPNRASLGVISPSVEHRNSNVGKRGWGIWVTLDVARWQYFNRLTRYAENTTWLFVKSLARRRLPRVWSSLLNVKIDVFGTPCFKLVINLSQCTENLTSVKLLLNLLLIRTENKCFETISRLLLVMHTHQSVAVIKQRWSKSKRTSQEY